MSSSTSLLDALLAFANEHDWSKRKQIVEQHHDLLLSDNAARTLDAAIAANAQRPEKRQALEQCQTVLADCRAIGVNAAFVLSIGPSAGLMEALTDLLSADSVAAAHQTTVQQKDLLLTDEADWVLTALAYENPQDAFFVERIAHRRELLARCRSEGIEPAFADMLREDRTTDALQALVRVISSHKQSEEVLGDYQDVLLTDQAMQQIGELASQPDLPPDVYRAVDAIRSLLTVARTDGIHTASITYLLPPFEQFITRCFFAMAKREKPDPDMHYGIEDILRTQLDKIDSSFPEKLHEWSQSVLETSTEADGLKIYFNAMSHLGKALGDLPFGDRAINQAASSACYVTANQFSQKMIRASQAAARKEQVFDSVESAVAEATRMKDEDGYDLFRGQQCAWPIASSFRRLNLKEQPEAKSRLNQFINWAKKEPALLQYGFSSDQAMAVAQHYGIPTTFLDFTTDIEVARYFATEHCIGLDGNNGEEQPELSCIVAIKSDHLKAWVKERFQQAGEFLGSEILELDVPNLWRLEAQAGVFLVDDALLDEYPFVYLLFPASMSTEKSRDRTSVYPDERSDLELILDQWFLHERASAGTRYALEEFERAGVAFDVIGSDPTDGIGLKGIIRPEPHPSWSECNEAWLREPERFDAVQPRPNEVLKIALSSGMDLQAVRSLVTELLPLDSLVDLRTRSVVWQCIVDGSADPSTSEKLRRQWDSLRIDGYSEAQMVESFIMSISLASLQLGLIAGWPKYDGSLGVGEDIEPLMRLFDCDLLVEFTGLVGYSRAVVSATALHSAVRDDIDLYLPADLYKHTGPSQAERMKQLLIGIHRPTLLFDFHRFVDLYVRQVIPMSVIFRPNLPLYPVLHLETFGVP
jgi:FRG domain